MTNPAQRVTMEKMFKKIMPGMFEVSSYIKNPDDEYYYILDSFFRIAANGNIEHDEKKPGGIQKIKKTNVHKFIRGDENLNNNNLVSLAAGFLVSMAYFNMVNELGIDQNLRDIKEFQSYYVGKPYMTIKMPEKTTPFKKTIEVPIEFIKLIAMQLTKN